MSGLPFSADMVVANLEGRKDMTRRVVGFNAPWCTDESQKQAMILEEHASFKSVLKTAAGGFVFCSWDIDSDHDKAKYAAHYANETGVRCPYGNVGDLTYGKEALIPVFDGRQDIVTYAADKTPVLTNGYSTLWQWKVRTLPSIFMPRFLSRLALIIREVRVERLLSISDSDARREGFADREHFLAYWDKLNGKRGFESKVNPWVWVIGYEVE
jgi:hypothetical protein